MIRVSDDGCRWCWCVFVGYIKLPVRYVAERPHNQYLCLGPAASISLRYGCG